MIMNMTAKRARRNYKKAMKECNDETLRDALIKIDFASKNGLLSVSYSVWGMDENKVMLLENQLILRGFEIDYDLRRQKMVIYWSV